MIEKTYHQNPYMDRWYAGHYIFYVTIQTMIINLNHIEKSIDKGDIKQAKESFKEASFLMILSGVAIEYAGNFEHANYVEYVRLYKPKQLSGLDQGDHKVLISRLKQLSKTVFSKLPKELEEVYKEFMEALQWTYDAHALVCEQFIGKKPSLKTSSKGKEMPAVDLVNQFKKGRYKMLEAAIEHLS